MKLACYKTYRCIIYLFFSVALSSCGFPEGYCIDPDDFGFPKISVPSKYSKDEVFRSCPNQYVEWKESDLVLNGDRLVVYVSGGKWNPYGITYHQEVECEFRDLSDLSKDIDLDGYADIINAPCVLKNGVGLYMLFAPNSTNPNENVSTIQSPDSHGFLTHHMGYNRKAYYDPRSKSYRGGINSPIEDLGAGYNDKIYMKILDSCYTDNTGSYTVTFKTGVSYTSTAPFIQPLINTVRNTLDKVYKKLFTGIVENGWFINYVRILIWLFIIYRAYLFLLGKTKGSLSEFVADILKVAIVGVLISDNSWNFFYKYVFTIFIDGVDELIGMFVPSNMGGTDYYDLLIQSMLTKELWYKILATMNLIKTGSFFGVVFGLIIIWAIGVFIYATLLAAIFYLLSLMGMAIMIAVAPIFLTLWLFEETKQLFQQWYQQLFIFLLQPVLIFAFLMFFFDMIYGIFHDYLGFRVCSTNMLGSWANSDAFRGIAPNYNLSDKGNYFGLISIPEEFYDGEKYCAAYECEGERWYDAPFLDPDNEWDAHRLHQLRGREMGGIFDVLYVWVLITILIQFQQKIPLLVGAMIRGRFFSWQGHGGSAWGGASSIMSSIGNIATGGATLAKTAWDKRVNKFEDPDSKEAKNQHSGARRMGSYGLNAIKETFKSINNPTKMIGNILRPDLSLPRLEETLKQEREFWQKKGEDYTEDVTTHKDTTKRRDDEWTTRGADTTKDPGEDGGERAPTEGGDDGKGSGE